MPAAKPTTGDIGGFLETLRAVLPATMAAAYSAGVIVLQNLAISNGAAERAAEQVALSKTYATDPVALKAALEKLPVETSSLIEVRYLYLVLATVFVLVMAYQAAQTKEMKASKKTPLFEPFVVSAAFVAWALASPGTPLAARFDAADLLIATVVIAIFAALVLAFVTQVFLTKKTT